MANDIRENKPWSKNQISYSKPKIPRTDSILTGYIANSMNGGHNKVIAFKQVMAGERHKEYRLQGNFKLLTPKTPTYQNLNITFRTYFVPNSRVWTNAEKYTAQKGGSSEIKIKEIPNLGGKTIPYIDERTTGEQTGLQNTTAWRDAYISTYLPRIGTMGLQQTGANVLFRILPKVSVLPLRGRKAIFNDFERNKEYDSPLQEYKGDTVSDLEWNSYLPVEEQTMYEVAMRARRNNSYYSDYRTELQGFEQETPNGAALNEDVALLNWSAFEAKISESRAQSENSQLNDWDIIAKIRGSKKLTEGKVQLIGQRTITLNYSAVTQSSNNNSPDVSEEFRTIGTQGAYSNTQIDVPLYAGFEFHEEGYIHIIATVSADSVYESAFDRLELNVTPLDQYRPDMLDDKKDVLYECETGTQGFRLASDYNKAVGFKRKYSEYFKLPNIIAGDMTSNNYYQADIDRINTFNKYQEVLTQKTFQFFETDRNNFFDLDLNITVPKEPWKDYTDLLINKNQAVKNGIMEVREGIHNQVYVMEQNQIFFVAKCICIAELPIDDSIKENYTTWGEH